MYSQPLHLINESGFYDSQFNDKVNARVNIIGNVIIDPSAAIATDVLLQADPGSQIIIAAGACIGVGTIVHAHGGIIDIGTDVTIGKGVLIVGISKVAANACIGAGATILNHDLSEFAVLPSGSLIGDTSRQVTEVTTKITESYEVKVTETIATEIPITEISAIAVPSIETQGIETYSIDAKITESQTTEIQITESQEPQIPDTQKTDTQKVEYKSTYVYESTQQVPIDNQIADTQKVEYKSTYVYESSLEQKKTVANAPIHNSDDESAVKNTQVYGQANLNKLLAKLLPHRQALNQPLQNDP